MLPLIWQLSGFRSIFDTTPLAQQSLFSSVTVPGGLQPAPVSAELSALADRLPAGLRFGTSSWSFPGWQGCVYQGGTLDETLLARKGLPVYAQHPLLRAVGVDRGFYAPVPPSTWRRWCEETPADFRFLLKAHAALTTPKSLRRPVFLQAVPDVFLDAAYARRHVIDPAQEALGDKLGVIVFQFSPLGERVWRHREALLARLDGFLSALPRGCYAFEWRDPEIFGEDYAALLHRHGALHGHAAHPRLPTLAEQAAWFAPTGPLIVRWLLARHLGYEQARQRFAPFDRLCEPDEATRSALVDLLGNAVAAGREAMVIINNKAEGSAPLSVLRLAEAISSARDRDRF